MLLWLLPCPVLSCRCCLSSFPPPLQPLLSQMLSSTPSARPNAAAFSGCQWFQEDMLLRCLQFLDTILQRDTGQKVSAATQCTTQGAHITQHC